MKLIQTFDQLKNYTLWGCQQFWYYVILLNPRELTKAGQAVLENLNIFHLDSGEECHYFIPGFLNTGRGLFADVVSLFRPRDWSYNVPNFGKLNFNDRDFVNFFKELENRNHIGWRYSGECELLLFNISEGKKIKLNDFASYNLDDIVRNHRNISEFIRTTINVGKDANDQISAKRILDEKFYEMIMPDFTEADRVDFENGWSKLRYNGFTDNSYMFISYSSRDFKTVSQIRNRLCEANIPCWMAPFDIPSGFNYALIIEHAIKHAGKFILMLSKSSAESVWVGKELKRAIARFQLESPEKICAVWLNGKFNLDDTPFALPLEDIQISIDLGNNPNNFYLLTSNEQQEQIQRDIKKQRYMDDIQKYLSTDRILGDLRKVSSRIRAIHAIDSQVKGDNRELLDMHKELTEKLDVMAKIKDITENEFVTCYTETLAIVNKLKQMI